MPFWLVLFFVFLSLVVIHWKKIHLASEQEFMTYLQVNFTILLVGPDQPQEQSPDYLSAHCQFPVVPKGSAPGHLPCLACHATSGIIHLYDFLFLWPKNRYAQGWTACLLKGLKETLHAKELNAGSPPNSAWLSSKQKEPLEGCSIQKLLTAISLSSGRL